MSALMQLATQTRVTACLDCGKCTPVCPVAEYLPSFSPRKLIAQVLNGDGAAALAACTACGACETRCPAVVRFTDFVRDARREIHGPKQPLAHCGVIEAAARTGIGRNPRQFLPPELRVHNQGETLFFIGCAPLFDAVFGYLKVQTANAARAAIRIMNQLGIEPAVLSEEFCCGHDQLWAGDIKTFRDLAQRNISRIESTGAKTVLTACAECARCLGRDYPEILGDVPFVAQHFSTWLADREGNEELSFSHHEGRVTYHDPCRLGRHLGETNAPRQVLDDIPDLDFVEMKHAKEDATCCGTEGFARCGAVAKAIQVGRLKEAADTGADTLLTACPKCQVHLACARHDTDVETNIDIRDLNELIADCVGKTDSVGEAGDGG